MKALCVLHPAWLHHVDTDGAGAYPLRWFALAVICLAIFIGQIDMTIVNLALPSIAADLDATTAETSDLAARLEVSGDDELSRLGRTVNGMLAALEASVRSQQQLVAEPPTSCARR